jgi:hypothetical protein
VVNAREHAAGVLLELEGLAGEGHDIELSLRH